MIENVYILIVFQEAVQWCLAVQKALLYCEWPDELLSLDAAGKELDENGSES